MARIDRAAGLSREQKDRLRAAFGQRITDAAAREAAPAELLPQSFLSLAPPAPDLAQESESILSPEEMEQYTRVRNAEKELGLKYDPEFTNEVVEHVIHLLQEDGASD